MTLLEKEIARTRAKSAIKTQLGNEQRHFLETQNGVKKLKCEIIEKCIRT